MKSSTSSLKESESIMIRLLPPRRNWSLLMSVLVSWLLGALSIIVLRTIVSVVGNFFVPGSIFSAAVYFLLILIVPLGAAFVSGFHQRIDLEIFKACYSTAFLPLSFFLVGYL